LNVGDRFNPYRMFVGSFIPNCILRCPDLSAGAKLTYARLCQYAGKDGEAFPTQETIGNEIGEVNERTVRRYLTELIEFGLLDVIRPEGVEKLKHKSNRYIFLWHDIFSQNIQMCLSGPDKSVLSGPDKNDRSGPDKSVLLRESYKENHMKEIETVDGKPPSSLNEEQTIQTENNINSDSEIVSHLSRDSKYKRGKKSLAEVEVSLNEKPPVQKNRGKKERVYDNGSKSKTTPRTSKAIVTHFKDMFKCYFKEDAPIIIGKDQKLIKLLLEAYGYDKTIQMINYLIEDWVKFSRAVRITTKIPTIGILWGFRDFIYGELVYITVDNDPESAW
jgi:hypothetical protein